MDLVTISVLVSIAALALGTHPDLDKTNWYPNQNVTKVKMYPNAYKEPIYPDPDPNVRELDLYPNDFEETVYPDPNPNVTQVKMYPNAYKEPIYPDPDPNVRELDLYPNDFGETLYPDPNPNVRKVDLYPNSYKEPIYPYPDQNIREDKTHLNLHEAILNPSLDQNPDESNVHPDSSGRNPYPDPGPVDGNPHPDPWSNQTWNKLSEDDVQNGSALVIKGVHKAVFDRKFEVVLTNDFKNMDDIIVIMFMQYRPAERSLDSKGGGFWFNSRVGNGPFLDKEEWVYHNIEEGGPIKILIEIESEYFKITLNGAHVHSYLRRYPEVALGRISVSGKLALDCITTQSKPTCKRV